MLNKYFRFALYLVFAIGFSVAKAGAYEDFFRAASADDARTVQDLLVRGFDPNTRDERGQNALYISQRDAAFKVAQALLAHPQLLVDQPNSASETALMMAALRGNTDWVGRLLDKGARIEGANEGDAPGWSPLHYAASAPTPQALELLLARGARVDARSPNGTTPLMMAAQYGPETAVDALLKQGADARLRNDLNLGVVDFAQRGGREALTKRLTDLVR